MQKKNNQILDWSYDKIALNRMVWASLLHAIWLAIQPADTNTSLKQVRKSRYL